MTLPDSMNKENTVDARQLKAMGYTLRTCIKQALKRRGLTCGMMACGELLQSNPGTVMMCVMPSSCDNVSVHIHQTLIQAFCRENNILVIELSDGAQLRSLVDNLSIKERDITINGKAGDTSCLLLQYPKRKLSKQDETLVQFFEEMTTRSHTVPHLSLPD